MSLLPNCAVIIFTVLLPLALWLLLPTKAVDVLQKNVYLIGESSKTHFTKEYNALDQCYAKENGQRIGSFALTVNIKGKCEKGLLLCYPGSLEQSGSTYNNGMTVGIQFNVKNQPNNSVALACAEEHQLVCASDNKAERQFCMRGTVWHGVRISGPFGGKQFFQLELSIAKEKYQFTLDEGTFQFSILFGNRHSLFTTLTGQDGTRIAFQNHDDAKVRDQYLAKKADKRIKLANYVGLWMLGLDLLPMLNRRTMHLHVYRGCACDSHAWFHHPHESRALPPIFARPPMPRECAVAGETKAPFNATWETIKFGNSVLVSFRLAKSPRYVRIELRDNKEQLKLSLTITETFISMAPGEFGNKNDSKIALDQNLLIENNSSSISIAFVVQRYFYEIKVNGEKCGEYFPWSSQWWRGEQRTEDIHFVSMQGDFYTESGEVGLNREEAALTAADRSVHFEEPAFAGQAITFRGQISESAAFVQLHLLQSAPEINDYFGTAIFALRLNFSSDGQSDFLEQKYQAWDDTNGRNEWKNFAEPIKFGFVRRGDPFELSLQLRRANDTDDEHKQELLGMIRVRLDSKSTSKAWELTENQLLKHFVTDVGIDGDAILLTAPQITMFTENETASSTNANSSTVTNLYPFLFIDPLLAVGDTIEISGVLAKRTDGQHSMASMRIYLLHETTIPYSNESQMPLEILFFFREPFYKSRMLVRSVSKKLCKGLGGICSETEEPSRLFDGSEFKIEISAEQNHYSIYVHGAFVAQFEPKLPIWAGNVLGILAMLRNEPIVKINRANGTISKGTGGVPAFVMRVENEKRIMPDKSIRVRGEIVKSNKTEEGNVHVRINLLYGALETSENFGKVVMQLNFSANALKCKFHGQKREETHELAKPIKPNESFNLTITFGGHRIESLIIGDQKVEGRHFNNSELLVGTNSALPSWAIQYIRIEGDLKLNARKGIEIVEEKQKQREGDRMARKRRADSAEGKLIAN